MAWFQDSEPTTRDLLVGVYDLTHYTRYCLKTPDEDVLSLMRGYFCLTGGIIQQNGGRLIKTLGDAGLAAFDAADSDTGVRCFLALKEAGDAWLRNQGYPGKAVVKLHMGPVACGLVGAPGCEILDTYGKTVNTAMLLESKGFAITPQVFRSLNAGVRGLFRKHTPPVTYISVDTPH